jgi:hypothetical protein
MIRSAMKDNTNKILSDLNMTLATLEVRDHKVKKWKLQFKLYDNEIYLRVNNKNIPTEFVSNYFNLYFPKHLMKHIKGIISLGI